MSERSGSDNNKIKNWWDGETPLTYEDILQRADHWTLGADAATATLLKNISSKIISRTHEVEAALKNVAEETDDINATLSNVTSTFHLLSNTQFIENRTYQDDERSEATLSKTQNDKEEAKIPEELMTSCKEAVAEGLNLVSGLYMKVEISDSDSDGEGQESPLTVYKRIDPYARRKLPHIIGSSLFYSDVTLGLYEKYPEEEGKDDEASSICSLDNDKNNTSESLRPVMAKSSKVKSEEESESDEFLPSQSSIARSSASPVKSLKMPFENPNSVIKEVCNNSSKKNSKGNISIHNGFASSSDDDGPLFSPPASNASRHSSKQSLASDQANLEKGKEARTNSGDRTPSGDKHKKIPVSRNVLFDSESEEEGLFSTRKPLTAVKAQTHSSMSARPKDPGKSLFSSSGDDDDDNAIGVESENSLDKAALDKSMQKKPVGGINIFNSAVTNAIRNQHNSGSGQESATNSTVNVRKSPKEEFKKSDSKQVSAGTTDGILSVNTKSSPSVLITPKNNGTPSMSTSSKSMETEPSQSTYKPAVHSLFSDEDDGLFCPPSAHPPHAASPPPLDRSSDNGRNKRDLKSSIFDDSDEDLFTPVRQTHYSGNSYLQGPKRCQVENTFEPPPLPGYVSASKEERKAKPLKSIFDSSSSDEEMFLPRKTKSSKLERKSSDSVRESGKPSSISPGGNSNKLSNQTDSSIKNIVAKSSTKPQNQDNTSQKRSLPEGNSSIGSPNNQAGTKNSSKLSSIFSSDGDDDDEDLFSTRSVSSKLEKNSKDVNVPSQLKPPVTDTQHDVFSSDTDSNNISKSDNALAVNSNAGTENNKIKDLVGSHLDATSESLNSSISPKLPAPHKIQEPNVPIKTNTIVPANTKTSNSSVNNLFDSSDEDIFNSNHSSKGRLSCSKEISESEKLPTNSSKGVSKIDSIFHSSDDDIFNSTTNLKTADVVGSVSVRSKKLSNQENRVNSSVLFLEPESANKAKSEPLKQDTLESTQTIKISESSSVSDPEKILCNSIEDDIFKDPKHLQKALDVNTSDNFNSKFGGKSKSEMAANALESNKIDSWESSSEPKDRRLNNTATKKVMKSTPSKPDPHQNGRSSLKDSLSSNTEISHQKTPKSIFSSDSDEDIFKTCKVPNKIKPNSQKSLFSDNEGDEIFSSLAPKSFENDVDIFSNRTKSGTSKSTLPVDKNSNKKEGTSKMNPPKNSGHLAGRPCSKDAIASVPESSPRQSGEENKKKSNFHDDEGAPANSTNRYDNASKDKLSSGNEDQHHENFGNKEQGKDFSLQSDKKNIKEEVIKATPKLESSRGSVEAIGFPECLSKVSSEGTLTPNANNQSVSSNDQENSEKVLHEKSASLTKKPVGGVLLFGGEELLSKLKKRSDVESNSLDSDSEQPESPVKKPVGGVQLFGGNELISKLKARKKSDSSDCGSENKENIETRKETPNTKKPLAKSKSVVSSEGVLKQSSDSSTLPPRPRKEASPNSAQSVQRSISQEAGVSFDERTRASDILVSLNKDRPKIQHQRKRPSKRKKREKSQDIDDAASSVTGNSAIKRSTISDQVTDQDSLDRVKKFKENDSLSRVNSSEKDGKGVENRSNISNLQRDRVLVNSTPSDRSGSVLETGQSPSLKPTSSKYTVEDIFGSESDVSEIKGTGIARVEVKHKEGVDPVPAENRNRKGFESERNDGEDEAKGRSDRSVGAQEKEKVVSPLMVTRESANDYDDLKTKVQITATSKSNTEIENKNKELESDLKKSNKKSSTINLFDDEDTESDIFKQAKNITINKEKRNSDTTKKNKAGQTGQDLESTKPTTRKADSLKKKSSSIFSDEDEDDESIFSSRKRTSKVAAAPPKVKTGTQASKRASLFSDEDSENDLFSSRLSKPIPKIVHEDVSGPMKEEEFSQRVRLVSKKDDEASQKAHPLSTKKEKSSKSDGGEGTKPSFVDPLMGKWS